MKFPAAMPMPRQTKRVTRRQSVKAIAAIVAATLAPKVFLGAGDKRPLRLAISVETLAGANVNDARAAYLVWLREVARHYSTQSIEVIPGIFIPSDDLVHSVRQGVIDCYGITALELAKLADLTDPDALVLQDYLAEGMEYVLLVHNSSDFKKIADLRDAHIVSHLHRDMVLLPVWLAILLAANGLSQPERFFASHKLSNNINQVVLPLFFRKIDAACLARRSWEMAVELNPQLGRDLRALAVSPRVIPIAFGFRRNTNAEVRHDVIDSIKSVSNFTEGQQIVALYQSRAFVQSPLSAMKPTLDLVREFERISAREPDPRKGQR